MARRNRKKNGWNSWFGKTITILAIFTLLSSSIMLIYEVSMDIKAANSTNKVQALYYGSTAQAEETEEAAPTEAPEEEAIEIPMLAPEELLEPVLQPQFEVLYAENNELIGWIKVEDIIDYPIVWKENDNDFYMDHDFFGDYSQAGWIFLDKRNTPDMEGDNLLIYGHNMKNGEMFGELDRYRDLDYFIERPFIEIQSAWEPEARKYVIISMFDASMNKSDSSYIKITHFDFETPDDKQAFIDRLCKRSIFDIPVETTPDDQLVILVTCSYSHNNGRFLVVAREVREDETDQQIIDAYNTMK